MDDFVAIICGLKSEGAVVRSALSDAGLNEKRFRIGVSGARAAEARTIAERYASDGARVLLSVGVSGGLDPSLMPGDLIVTSDVVRNGGDRIAVHAGFQNKLTVADFQMQEGGEEAWRAGPILGSDVIVQSADEKARLFAETGALAVDMESHAVAEIAAARGLSFFAIRSVADPSDRALPAAAMDAVAPDGSTRVIRTLMKAASSPAQFPALVQLGRDSGAALKRLRTALPSLLAVAGAASME
ncbi:MAG: hypothetical protein GC152_11705 [Alphaproteobacteria bacterium]|nr:hypothetical protein [Alphaproteobacteria bacterium]